MPNYRTHPYLHIDRNYCLYEYKGRKSVIRKGQPVPTDLVGKEYIVLPLDKRPPTNTVIPLHRRINEGGKESAVEKEVYDVYFLNLFFSQPIPAEELVDLLSRQHGYYNGTKRTTESFLEYLESLLANAKVLLGGKVDEAAFLSSPSARVLLDWIQQQKGFMELPAAPRKAKSRAQVLDLKTQLAIIYYLHKGGELQRPLTRNKELVTFLAGLLARTANSIEPLVGYLTEVPSMDRNHVLTEKYMRKAAEFFRITGSDNLADLVEKDLVALR